MNPIHHYQVGVFRVQHHTCYEKLDQFTCLSSKRSCEKNECCLFDEPTQFVATMLRAKKWDNKNQDKGLMFVCFRMFKMIFFLYTMHLSPFGVHVFFLFSNHRTVANLSVRKTSHGTPPPDPWEWCVLGGLLRDLWCLSFRGDSWATKNTWLVGIYRGWQTTSYIWGL